jgi:predicted RNase H-like HicB family nuclease
MNLQVARPKISGNNFSEILNGKQSPMLLEYIQAGLRHAKYEILPDDGSYYGAIPECAGVYSNADNLEDCRDQVREVLEEWVLFRVHRNLPIPAIDGIEIAIKEVA